MTREDEGNRPTQVAPSSGCMSNSGGNKMATRILASKTALQNYQSSRRAILSLTSLFCNRKALVLRCCRQQHSDRQSDSNNNNKLPAETTSGKRDSQVTIGEKVKQTTKDAYYGGIIVVGVGVTCILFYAIFRELFSKESPNGIYGKALKLCLENPRIPWDNRLRAMAKRLPAAAEGTRGSYVEYVQDGVNHIRMKFYVEGSRRKGTVHLEVKQNSNGKYEYRYLFVEMSDYPKETIILQDNR